MIEEYLVELPHLSLEDDVDKAVEEFIRYGVKHLPLEGSKYVSIFDVLEKVSKGERAKLSEIARNGPLVRADLLKALEVMKESNLSAVKVSGKMFTVKQVVRLVSHLSSMRPAKAFAETPTVMILQGSSINEAVQTFLSSWLWYVPVGERGVAGFLDVNDVLRAVAEGNGGEPVEVIAKGVVKVGDEAPISLVASIMRAKGVGALLVGDMIFTERGMIKGAYEVVKEMFH